jgi:hypothetical protein
MNSTDIVAYIGACAWLAPLIQLGYNYFTKPCIRIIPDRSAQIGWTTLGLKVLNYYSRQQLVGY